MIEHLVILAALSTDFVTDYFFADARSRTDISTSWTFGPSRAISANWHSQYFSDSSLWSLILVSLKDRFFLGNCTCAQNPSNGFLSWLTTDWPLWSSSSIVPIYRHYGHVQPKIDQGRFAATQTWLFGFSKHLPNCWARNSQQRSSSVEGRPENYRFSKNFPCK